MSGGGAGTADTDWRPTALRGAAELAAMVREAVAANAVRDVLLLRLGPLGTAFRRPPLQRLLREALDPLASASRTRVFELPNGDVVAIATPPGLALETARQSLLRTLEGAAAEAAGGVVADLVTMLRLPEAAVHLLAVAAESLGLEPGEDAAPAAGGRRLGGADVAAAERALAHADLEPVTLRQAVCLLDPDGGSATRLWEDRRIDWPALAVLVLPGVDVTADAALHRRLARLAALRLLVEIGRPGVQARWSPMGVAVTPGTLGLPGFHRFDEGLPAGRRKEITLGFAAADVLADPAGFVAARDMARARGYRLALDEAPAAALQVLVPERLGLDVLRLRWAPDLPLRLPPRLAALLAAPNGADSVVLTGVDRPAAVAWGWEIGIRRFQGPLVEKHRRAA